ncbi:DUF2249 domain-containing protein [Pontibacter sp. SGAir0037]|uniref:DUF2249 domain-containing protein n=1 Tax=Pontibacter sp. SGAir0037 TaxID=2571030 RepID=UPI0010CD00ED|nr:DUF2249 domain-containing protein [Pontibacter sp. SGAir0037]QCR22475.1 hypothetical protein C1N53_09095 [Pontibacter sp. SGAir0037]
MTIAPNTKISAIIKANPEAIEAIASINKHFARLRNPLLRKVLASRVTIADAARIGCCEVDTFFEKLVPLGFTINNSSATPTAAQLPKPEPELPGFPVDLSEDNILSLDVREAISTGQDPFLEIMGAVEEIGSHKVLRLINTFEPTPLIAILQKKGYTSFTEEKAADLVYTYFRKQTAPAIQATENTLELALSFEAIEKRFEGKCKYLDVRHLEIPQPMISILNELELLPPDRALYVAHKRIPQYLLPQLQERGFSYTSKSVGLAEVYLIIYKEI